MCFSPWCHDRGVCVRGSNIRALHWVHGLQRHRPLHVLLSCHPHQRRQEVPELQRGPGKESKPIRYTYFLIIALNGLLMVCILELTDSPLEPGSPLAPGRPWSPCWKKHTHFKSEKCLNTNIVAHKCVLIPKLTQSIVYSRCYPWDRGHREHPEIQQDHESRGNQEHQRYHRHPRDQR